MRNFKEFILDVLFDIPIIQDVHIRQLCISRMSDVIPEMVAKWALILYTKNSGRYDHLIGQWKEDILDLHAVLIRAEVNKNKFDRLLEHTVIRVIELNDPLVVERIIKRRFISAGIIDGTVIKECAKSIASRIHEFIRANKWDTDFDEWIESL